MNCIADHPRIRGEHTFFALPPERPRGSSPHTRGAQDGSPASEIRQRIIPAYAGSTNRCRRGSPGTWDHPRIRGEHRRKFSSPHPSSRIIPAYAGSTRRSSFPYPFGGDHPRIRGEHNLAKRTGLPASGSSPHTRGARRADACRPPCGRIIPAYAGSTPGPRRGRGWLMDHPRIRGEHHVFWLCRNSNVGSSPHTRGAPYRGPHESIWHGIIPAYAGSTMRNV